MSTTYLKVKICSLAEEARIIRRIERKARQSARWLYRHQQPSDDAYRLYFGLKEHRKVDVREEARAALIAYAFLRGRAYRRCETTKRDPKWNRVYDLVAKYGPNPNKQDAEKAIWAWVKA